MDHDKTALLLLQAKLGEATKAISEMGCAHADLVAQVDAANSRISQFKKKMMDADESVISVLAEIERIIKGKGIDPRTIEATIRFIRSNPGIPKSQLGYRCRKYANLHIEDKDKLLKRFVDDGLIEVRYVLKTKKSTNPAAHLYPTQCSKTKSETFDY